MRKTTTAKSSVLGVPVTAPQYDNSREIMRHGAHKIVVETLTARGVIHAQAINHATMIIGALALQGFITDGTRR